MQDLQDLPEMVASQVPETVARATRVLIGVVESDLDSGDNTASAASAARTLAAPAGAHVDFRVPPHAVQVVAADRAAVVMPTIAAIERCIIGIEGGDPVDRLAGQAIAVVHGARALVVEPAEVGAARRTALMLSRILEIGAGPDTGRTRATR